MDDSLSLNSQKVNDFYTKVHSELAKIEEKLTFDNG